MKVIDLLNKIANGEAPKKIKYNNEEYYLYGEMTYLKTDKSRFFDRIQFGELNNEVEITEEDKKIEKIDVNHLQQIKKWKRAKILGNKINEIIDYLEEKE